jgi:hypothetical protein
VAGVQLLFDAIDRLDHVFLIATRKGHARDGMLYSDERLMYCGLLRPIHGVKSEPVWLVPQVPQIKRAPPFTRRGPVTSATDYYLAGAVSAAVEAAAFALSL